MDSSPRPQRRFSRWQTTKRTFVLGGVTYAPPATKKVQQEDHEKSETLKKPEKFISDKIIKSGKNHKKNFSNSSTVESVAKQIHQSSLSVEKPPVVRRLCLDSNKGTESRNEVIIIAETTQLVQEESGSDLTSRGSVAAGKERLHQNTNADKGEKCVEADPSLSQNLLFQRERGESRNYDIGDETAHQNNLHALSNISQNTSADMPSQNAPASKPATIQTRSSQTKGHISLSCVTQNVPEAGVITNEANRRKRQAADDGESSDTSSTDKENKDKDSLTISVPSPVKKLKQDGALQNLSTSNEYKTAVEQNIEYEVLSARRSTLRNRNLLTSRETLLKNRQYPIFHTAEKKIMPEKISSKGKEMSSVRTESSFNKKSVNKRQLPQSEVKRKQQNTTNTSSKKTTVHKNQSHIDKGVNLSSNELKKQNGSLHKSKIQNISEAATSRSASSFSTTPAADKKCKNSQEADSNCRRSGLRDRSLLPSPEEVQQKRRYPVHFLLPCRGSASSNVNSNSKHEIADKRKQKELIKNREAATPLEQNESSSISKKVFKEHHLISNKFETQASSVNRSNSRKSSSTLKNSALSSHSLSKKLSPPKKIGKLLHNPHGTKTATKTIHDENMSVKALAGNEVNKPSSLKQRLKKPHETVLEDHTSAAQSKVNLAGLSRDINCDSPQENGQESHQVKKTVKSIEKELGESRVADARVSVASRKSLNSKAKNRHYSLPRKPVNKSSNRECNSTSFGKGSCASFASTDISVQPLQLSTILVDASWKQSQKIAHKKHPTQLKPNTKGNNAPIVSHRDVAVTRSDVSVNETIVVSQKQPRKRKLLKELDRAEEVTAQTATNNEGQVVALWCEDGVSRKGSGVAAFDVIMQAVVDTEDKLLDDTEDNFIKHKVVKKVMRKFKRNLKPLILKMKEVKDLQFEIRQKSSRIRKLMADIDEQQKKKAQFRSEIHNRIGSDQDVGLINVNEFMKDYNRLMQAYDDKCLQKTNTDNHDM